nr:inositol monophosphatase [Sediminivirga luteola]
MAEDLADAADAITMSHFGGDIPAKRKADRTLVTQVDLAVDQTVRTLLRERAGGDLILSEEGPPLPWPAAGRVWVIDPLDQTVNYSRGIEEFATLITLCMDAIPQVAVVSAPARGERWYAQKDHGAYRNGHRLQASVTHRIEDALLTIAAPHQFVPSSRTGVREDMRERVDDVARRAHATTGHGGFLGQMRVAAGAVDAAIDPWGQPWDLAASSLIVTEAGGRFTDLSGHSGFSTQSALASNGVLHPALLDMLLPG